jgi:hypothetical protein
MKVIVAAAVILSTASSAVFAASDIPKSYTGNFPNTQNGSRKVNGKFTGKELAIKYVHPKGGPTSFTATCTVVEPNKTRCAGKYTLERGDAVGKATIDIVWADGKPTAVRNP